MMKSISGLEKCIPVRGNSHMDWQVLERNNHAKKRKDNKRLLPLSIMVKIKGPPKVLDSYKMPMTGHLNEDENDSASCTPLNLLPSSSQGYQLTPIHDKHALPARPAFIQSKQIPGRYFPKPTINDEVRMSSMSANETDLRLRPDTVTPREQSWNEKKNGKVIRSCDFNRAKAEAINAYNDKIIKSRKSLSQYTRNHNLHFNVGVRDQDVGSSSDSKSETQSVYSTRRLFKTSRHVSVPRKNMTFVDILTGTPKTLHKKDDRVDSELKTEFERSSTGARVLFEENNLEIVATPIST